MLRDVVTSAVQALREFGRGLGFMPRKFGVLVQIKVEGVGVGIGVFNFFRRWSLSAGNDGEQKEERKFEQGHGPGSYLPVPGVCKPMARKTIGCNDFQSETILILRRCIYRFPSFPPGVQSA